jgi:hypothetical protein
VKSERAINLQLRRIASQLATSESDSLGEAQLFGAQQALTWALGVVAMAPSRAFGSYAAAIAASRPTPDRSEGDGDLRR